MPKLKPSEMDRATFMRHFGPIYEHSEWVAERAFETGLTEAQDTPAGLARHMEAIVASAPQETQLALLRQHPELAGREAAAGCMTASSVDEQSSAGLDSCSAEELATLKQLNRSYDDRFGFPFIMAVSGKTLPEILRAFAERLENAPAAEHSAALEQVSLITRMRIERVFTAAETN